MKCILINRKAKNIILITKTGTKIPTLVSIENTSSVITDPSLPMKLEFVGVIITKNKTINPPLKKILKISELFTLSSLLHIPIDNPARTKVMPTESHTLIKSSSG